MVNFQLQKMLKFFLGLITTVILLSVTFIPAHGTRGNEDIMISCEQQDLQLSKERFLDLLELKNERPGMVPDGLLQSYARAYIDEAEKCYSEMETRFSDQAQNQDDETVIYYDDGGQWAPGEDRSDYVLNGRKWGGNSPYDPAFPPGTPGGTVTYSFMPNGVSFSSEDPSYGSNVAITSLPTYQSCFLTEIRNAFAAWAAVANIQFVEVSDTALPFDSPGAIGDIRIGAHTFDGSSGILAHAYYPPPNGDSAAGDLHFDRSENWTCNSSGIDIGIVAMHELGHSIGLNHENTSTVAVMDPIYNPAMTTLQPDDINGAVAIYGSGCHTLTTAINPGSSGSINVSPPSNCTGGKYTNGTVVNLTPIPTSGYTFAIWTGSASGNTNPLAITMNANKIVTANFMEPLPVGIYDDTDVGLIYTDTWNPYTASGPYDGTLHYSTTVGNFTQFMFDGIRFKLTYTGHTNRGVVDIYVDNVKVYSLNEYASSLTWQKVWTSGVYAAGVHTVKLVHASGAVVDVDAIRVLDSVDSNSPSAINALSAATGTTAGSVNLSWTAVGDDGGSGTATSYQVRYSASAITSESAWNAATPVTSGVPVPKESGQPESMTVTGLTPGATYYFTVRALDEEPNMGTLGNSPSAVAKAYGIGTYDDGHSGWSYTGMWMTYSSSGPYNGTLHYSTAVGNEARFTFEGRKFKLIYTGHTNRGMVDIYVDTVKVYSLNEYASSLTWQKAWTSGVYAGGVHTVKLVHASGAVVDVDAIQALTPLDTDPPAAINTLVAATGSARGSVNLSWTAVGDDGGSGTATSYQVRYSASAITSESAWSAATQVTSGVPVPKESGQAESMTVTGLVPGATYYFAVRAFDEEPNPGGLGNSPSAAAATGGSSGVGKYDDTDGGWSYAGTWMPYTNTGPYNGTLHYSTTVGNYTEFTFNGSQFILYYTGHTNRGVVDIYVDTVKVYSLNQYASSLTWQQAWVSGMYTVGIHTVKLVHASGGVADVDAIQILMLPDSYDDTGGGWSYTGAWTAYTNTGPYNGTLHYSTTIGNYTTFTFTGSQFILYYTGHTNRGVVDIYVDNVKVYALNEYASSLTWQKKWASGSFTAGVHTVKVVHASGGVVDVDAITIMP